jgi:hypothetical protein
MGMAMAGILGQQQSFQHVSRRIRSSSTRAVTSATRGPATVIGASSISSFIDSGVNLAGLEAFGESCNGRNQFSGIDRLGEMDLEARP